MYIHNNNKVIIVSKSIFNLLANKLEYLMCSLFKTEAKHLLNYFKVHFIYI